jgi:glycosyltransferase involved in cell wall biosynthesis
MTQTPADLTNVQHTRPPRVLCVIGAYLPGYKAGGPIKSLSSLINALSNELEFFVLTKDRDLNSNTPYPDIKPDQWTRLEHEYVWYASKGRFGIAALLSIFRQTKFDVLYLNSFFHFQGSAIPLVLLKLGLIRCDKVILAPRGEFSPNALKLKWLKKRVFLMLSKLLGLHSTITWQASTELEATQIVNVFGSKNPPFVAANISSQRVTSNTLPTQPSERLPGPTRVVFISRIAPIKNLDFFFVVLTKCTTPLEFHVYGPIESSEYWSRCLDLANNLPSNIKFYYHGDLKPNDVHSAFQMYDVFFLPTGGENFGHVIFESLSAGTPVVISDKTPWVQSADASITVLSLSKPEDWVTTAEAWSRLGPEELKNRRQSALNAARTSPVILNAISQNKRLFGLK